MTDQELIKQLRCFDSLSDVPDVAAEHVLAKGGNLLPSPEKEGS